MLEREVAGRFSRLAEFHENFCVEFGSDPKSSNLHQFIEHRFAQIDDARAFRFSYDAEEPSDGYPRRSGGPME